MEYEPAQKTLTLKSIIKNPIPPLPVTTFQAVVMKRPIKPGFALFYIK